MVEPTLLDSSA